MKYLIHGGPQGAWGDDWSYRWNPELFAANGYVVVMVNFHGSTGYGQKFIDAINGNWGGPPYQDLMLGLDYAEQHYSYIDKDRECALGASYGGYAINWIEGHSTRFKCLVSHDGMFNTISAYGTTEELWFNEWEFKGTPWTNRALYDKWSPEMFAANFKTPLLVVHGQLGLSARCLGRLPAVHDAAAAEGSVEDAVLPGRRSLGAEAAERPAVVQDGERLGRRVDEDREVAVELEVGKDRREIDGDWRVLYCERMLLDPAFGGAIVTALRFRIDDPDILYSHATIIVEALLVTRDAIFRRQHFDNRQRSARGNLFDRLVCEKSNKHRRCEIVSEQLESGVPSQHVYSIPWHEWQTKLLAPSEQRHDRIRPSFSPATRRRRSRSPDCSCCAE